MLFVWRRYLRRCGLRGMHCLLGGHVLGRRFRDLRYLCSGDLHGRQHFGVHGLSRWVLLGHTWVRFLHHLHVRHLRRRGFRELHQLLCGILFSWGCIHLCNM